jgi:hypothetical protein
MSSNDLYQAESDRQQTANSASQSTRLTPYPPPSCFPAIPPVTTADCAPGFGRTETTFSKLTPNGKTRLVKTFSCSQCGPNQVPLTPQAGLRITNAGVVLIQEPIVIAAGEKVPRGKYLPAPAAKRFNLTPGQCVECPAGSVRTADGISCEGEQVLARTYEVTTAIAISLCDCFSGASLMMQLLARHDGG